MLWRRLAIFAVGSWCLWHPVAVLAEMSSTNYYIYADTIGVSGGALATSSNFRLQDTAGESPAGFTTSTSYELRGGYQAMERGILSLTLSKNSLDLGALVVTTVNSDTTVAAVSADSLTGYTLLISGVSGTMPAAVADGAVTAGSEEYGFAASGANVLVSGDVAVANNLVISSTSSPVANDTTALTFKASRSPNGLAGTYSQTITLTVSANF